MLGRRFFKHSAVYGATNILSRGISLLLLPFYTRVLSPSDYGIIDILAVFATLVYLTVALEISQGVARYFTDSKDSGEKIAYASTALWFSATVYTLFTLIVFASSAKLVQWILESQEHEPIFQIAVLSIWGRGIFYLAQNQIRWQLQPKLYAISSIFFTLVSTGMTVLLVLGLRLGVIGVFYGQLTGNFAGAAMALYFTRHSYRLVFDWAKWREMLQFSIPLVPSSIAVFFAAYVDRIAIKTLMSMTDLGLYGIGFRLASVVSLLMVGFRGALTPLVLTHHRDPDMPAELAKIFRYFLALAMVSFLGLSVFAREILSIFARQEYYSASVLLPFLVPAVWLSGMYIFAPGLAIAKKTKVLGLITCMSAGINAVLNFLLIPYLGVVGAAVATLVGAFSGFAALMAVSQRLYPVPHWKNITLSVFFMVGLVVVNELMSENSYLGSETFLMVPLKSAILVCGMIFVSWAMFGCREIGAVVSKIKFVHRRDAVAR